MFYAHVRNNEVINVFEWFEQNPPEISGDVFVALADSEEKKIIGYTYDGTSFAPSVDTEIPILEITLDKTIATADATDTITLNFTIKNADGSIMTTFSGDYKIILRRDDNTIYKLFKVAVSNGQGTITIKSNKADRFKLIPSDFTYTKLASEIRFDFVEVPAAGSVTL